MLNHETVIYNRRMDTQLWEHLKAEYIVEQQYRMRDTPYSSLIDTVYSLFEGGKLIFRDENFPSVNIDTYLKALDDDGWELSVREELEEATPHNTTTITTYNFRRRIRRVFALTDTT